MEKKIKKRPMVRKEVKKPFDVETIEEVVEEPIELVEVEPKNEINGLGDWIKSVTTFFGIIPCDACEERRVKLNKLFPFTKFASELNDDEINFLKRVRYSNTIGSEDRNYIFLLYNKIFNQKLQPCQCPSIIMDLREKLWQAYLANHSKNIDEI